jgi:hypothetical protein
MKKSTKHLSYVSVSLATLLAVGNCLPVLAGVSSNQNNRSSFISSQLNDETLLAQLNFSGNYGNAPARSTTGSRRGGCLAGGLPAIAILPDASQTLESTSAELETTTEELNSEKGNLKQLPVDEPNNATEEMTPLPQENQQMEEAPETQNATESSERVWFTADQYPSVYFYLPENWANKAEFVLYNEQEEIIYSAQMTLPGSASVENPRQAGIIEVNLENQKDNIVPLEEGQSYLWEVQVLCDEVNRSGNPTVNGWIQLVDQDTSTALNQDLEQVTDESKRSEIYAENGIWYNLVSNIYDHSNVDDWTTLLEQIGMKDVINSQMLGSATITNTYEGELPPL